MVEAPPIVVPGGQLALLPPGVVAPAELLPGELALGELEYDPLDCAIAPAENASSALAVAAASILSFIRDAPFKAVGIAHDRCGSRTPFCACKRHSRDLLEPYDALESEGASSEASRTCSAPRSAGFTRW